MWINKIKHACYNWCMLCYFPHICIYICLILNSKNMSSNFVCNIYFRNIYSMIWILCENGKLHAKKKLWMFISLYFHLSLFCFYFDIEVCWMCTGSNFNQSTWMKMMSLNNDFLYCKLCSFLMLSNFYLFVMIPKRMMFALCVCMFVVALVRWVYAVDAKTRHNLDLWFIFFCHVDSMSSLMSTRT